MDYTKFRLAVIGLNHKSSPIELRERVSFSPSQREAFLRLIRKNVPLVECVVISTCNRVEIYFVQKPNGALDIAGMITLFTQFHKIPREDIAPFIYSATGETAIFHLCRVAAGLDSLVIGETQILGQVKHAYQFSLLEGFAGKVVNQIFQKAFSVCKKIRTDTRIGRGNVSISSVACQLAEEVLGTFHGKKVLLIGVGKIGRLTLKSLGEKGAKDIFIANRTYDTAKRIADECDGVPIPFNEIATVLEDMDVAITCTSFPYYILDPKLIRNIIKDRGRRQLFLVDLAVPRDIDPEVQQIPGVHLYNVDSLKNIAGKNLMLRSEELAICNEIIQESVYWMTQKYERPEFLKTV